MLVRRALLLRAVAICLGFTCILVACSGNRRESFYPSLADADKDGAITRGWIPGFLPNTSHAIHEVHEISPSTEWCAFDFLPTDSQGLRKALTSVDAAGPRVRRVPNPDVSWWPAMLNGNLDVEKIRKAGFELYVVERPATSVSTDELLIAIDWPNGRGFFYSSPE